MPRLASILLLALLVACSTGDPDPDPNDAGRIERTTVRVDSALNPAREHIRAIDSIGDSAD